MNAYPWTPEHRSYDSPYTYKGHKLEVHKPDCPTYCGYVDGRCVTGPYFYKSDAEAAAQKFVERNGK